VGPGRRAAVLVLVGVAGACSIDRSGGFRGDAGGGGGLDACSADLDSDPNNCGACGNVCSEDAPNASPACVAGACGVRCDPGFGDCDGDPSNGCEAPLSDPATCGACDVACSAKAPFCDGGACSSACSGGRVECGMACVDIDTDPSHCGGCGVACLAGLHQTTMCSARLCVGDCDEGWEDCDLDPSNGCEQSLDDVASCGGCGMACDFANASESCVARTCTLGACDPGFADCNAVASDGCETPLDSPTDCGGCGIACDPMTPYCDATAAVPTCVSGCAAGEMLCDGGCVLTGSDPNHCSACGASCGMPANGAPTCTAGMCGVACYAGFADCNVDPGDGCETPLDSVTDCTACATPCMPPNATGDCSSGRCRVASCNSGYYNCNAMPGDGCESTEPCCATACDASCGTGDCCTRICDAAVPCAQACGTGCICNVNCRNNRASCMTTCGNNGRCFLDCARAATCALACTATGARCLLNCNGVSGACELLCDPALLTDCGGGVFACNRPCP
jgi:hypothetical protein